jgi:uncharacterized paraquat-inducible protein A
MLSGLPEQMKVSRRRSYANGYKYCSRCRTYYLTDDNRCPYCRILLRVSPRKKSFLKDKKFVKAPEEIVLASR